jgi:hypothetical protein
MQKIDDCKEIRLALTRAGIATRPEKCLQIFRLVVTAQYIYHMRYVSLLALLCRSSSSIPESREFFARSSRSTSARISYSSLSGTRTLIRRGGIYPPPIGFSTAPYANKTSSRNMCRADICNTCRCTKFTVWDKKSRKSSIASSFVESGRISLMYASKVRMNLKTFLSCSAARTNVVLQIVISTITVV